MFQLVQGDIPQLPSKVRERPSLVPNLPVRHETLAARIFLVRGERVMLSQDLADLYGVAVKALTQATKRNANRFPPDFMFQLSQHEFDNLKSQSVTSSWGGLRRALPYAFTEQGVAMLSSVLRSARAVEVNIAIMRTFVQLRRMMDTNRELALRIDALEARYDEQFAQVFDAIRELIAGRDEDTDLPARRIGFTP